ncbi:glycoside hydrolase family 65 protein [Acetobacteraceae bacterium H6797]|nr:glycoside hydrolase family 65 protein [Acetobacteraceae bacterium H6797]
MDSSARLNPAPDWLIEARDVEPGQWPGLAARFALGNGFLGWRAGPSLGGEGAEAGHFYVAGLFETPRGDNIGIGQDVPLLLHAGRPFLRLLVHGAPLPLRHGIALDMRAGLLREEVQAPGCRMAGLRFVSRAEKPVAVQRLRFEIGFLGEVSLEAGFDGLDPLLELLSEAPGRAVWQTASGKHLAIAGSLRLSLDGIALMGEEHGALGRAWRWQAVPGQVLEFERVLTFARDGEAAALPVDLAAVYAAHERAMAECWKASDVAIEGEAEAQGALRFALHHLIATADEDDPRVSIGARALTGDDYHGHVFWDTEIYLLPFYTWTWPEAARALLLYRHVTLPGARAKAAAIGCKGALYAWESTDTGFEATPERVVAPDGRVVEVLSGKQEQHISADVSYAVWHYWKVTGDDAFMREAGAEIMLETARFWASRAERGEDGRYHIRRVIGPDEYHEGIDDNAFTNLMARWNIRRAIELAEAWPDARAKTGLGGEELAAWAEVAEGLVTGRDPSSGLLEQFAGYFALEEIDLAAYEGHRMPMDVVLGRERVAVSRIVKQADVVALLALLPEEFTQEEIETNFAFYDFRCAHGSSLSRVMHGLVAARLGRVEKALEHFRLAAAVDLGAEIAKSAGGIHIATQGGLWQLAVLGFAGLSWREDGIALAPCLPEEWTGLRFALSWHGRQLIVSISDGQAELLLEEGTPMRCEIAGQSLEVRMGEAERVTFAIGNA